MTEAMPFLQKYDITFLRPPTILRRPFGILWITSTESRSNPYSRRDSPAADPQ